jgi:hypothetical protein
MFTSSRHAGAFLLAGLISLHVLSIGVARSQNAPGTHQDNGGINGSLSRGDLEKLNGDRKLEGGAGSPKDSAQARAKARAQSAKLIEALHLACQVGNAQMIVAGTRKSAATGKQVDTRVFEVACDAGMGYLLEAAGSEPPVGISCLSAELARAADVEKGREPGFFCKLPENKDVYAGVSSMMAAAGGPTCVVHDLKAFGRSASSASEYTEVACQDGSGFLLRLPLPGSASAVTVTSCADAAKQGTKCRLTDAGPVEVPVTLDTFKAALASHGVSCRIEPIRMIGQEDHLKRYVVEYRCADQAAATVAFLPLQGNTNPYESIDCKSAASEHGVNCEYAPTH